MSVKFSEIMKKFYEDEMLGIKTEDAPANSVASGGVDMPPNAVSKRNKKKIKRKICMMVVLEKLEVIH